MSIVLQKRDVNMDDKFKIVKPLLFKDLPEANRSAIIVFKHLVTRKRSSVAEEEAITTEDIHI